jgi:MFS family permease
MNEIKENSRLRNLFRALRSRNYRLFYAGQGISLIGTWMQQVAMSWLVYRLTDSVFLLGMVAFAGQIPAFLLGPFAGVVSDRFNRHRTLILTQTLSLLQASTLAALVLTDQIAIWHILALSALLGIINAFDIAARQAFVVELVEKREDLSNAIALNSSLFNLARLVGPAVAGVIIAAVGEGLVFGINAASYLAVIFSLTQIRLRPVELAAETRKVGQVLLEGFRYAFGFPPIRAVILQVALVSLFGMPFSVLMPAVARDILAGDANTLGLLMGASGIGALMGALYLASRQSVLGLGKIIIAATILFGAGLMAFAFSETLWLSLLLILLAGFGMMVQMASNNTILQTIVDDDKRGRVMSFYSMAFMGMAPIGGLLAGAVAEQIGVTYTLFASGALVILSALPFAWHLRRLRELVRPIYQRQGILPNQVGAPPAPARQESQSVNSPGA